MRANVAHRRHGKPHVTHATTVLLLTLTLIGGVGAAVLATLLAVPVLVLIATGEAAQNLFAHAQRGRHA